MQVVGEAETGRQAVTLIRKLLPAVVVMDIAMPLLNGLEATRQIRKAIPDTKVLILSAHSDDAYIERARAVGASGFLLKQASSHHLATAIREIQKGTDFFRPPSPRPHNLLGTRTTSGQDESSPKTSNRLSPREMEVLQLIAEGKPNKQVAAELGVSFKTVDKHRQHLMTKLNIHDTAGLTRYAINAGIIESSVHLTIL
jgi:DNA-binding NarL/FixJ family response regulator